MPARTRSRSARIRISRRTAVVLVAGLGTVLALGACSPGVVGDTAGAGPIGHQAGVGGGRGVAGGGGSGGAGGPVHAEQPGSGEGGDLDLRIADLPVATLTAEEIDGLLWMREEEKLAHDVYVALGDAWGGRVFENVARAESTHTEAVATLLDRYGITDPAAGPPAGLFTNPDIRALYDDLLARGKTSLVDAFTVGALIEELDLSDLHARATDTPDIALVYADLERGSENHLRAFVRNLGRQGETYTPTRLSQAELDSITGAVREQGQTG